MRNTRQSPLAAPIFGISRLRMGVDGPGITTLVAFMGCPLACRYCLNPHCHDDPATLKGVRWLTPQQLYERVKLDNIYFQATGGGICFGGGEPTLYTDFIEEFRRICKEPWKITLETALPCNYLTIHRLSKVVDHWIVDIKDMNSWIYREYTQSRAPIIQRLYSLRLAGAMDRTRIRVPHIPHFNTDEDVRRSIKELKKIGFTDIEELEYITDIKY